jgi:hypothetical protein
VSKKSADVLGAQQAGLGRLLRGLIEASLDHRAQCCDIPARALPNVTNAANVGNRAVMKRESRQRIGPIVPSDVAPGSQNRLSPGSHSPRGAPPRSPSRSP